MAHADTIVANARKLVGDQPLPDFYLVRSSLKYEQFVISRLDDGTPLDPFYAAKMLPFVRDGDCLWLTGLRPVCSMPSTCQKEFSDWQSPKKGAGQ